MIRSEIKNFNISSAKIGSFPCTVPCTLLSVLSERGLYTAPTCEGDIARSENLFDEAIDFETVFTLTSLDLSRRYIYLRFRGLDTSSEIYLNGRLIAKTENSASVYTVDVKNEVHEGDNSLKIRFLPDGTDSFCRPSYRVAGDYGFTLSDCGILAPVELLKFNNAVIDNIRVSQRAEGESVVLSMQLDTLGNPDSVKAVATLVSCAGQVYYGGFSRGVGTVQVRQPLYWWPRGLGMQNLYRLTVNLYGDRDIEDSAELSVGIGELSVAASSASLTATANGVTFVPFATTYTQPDLIPARATDGKIKALISSLAATNANTLIVQGSAGFADERLLSAADECGITVWQELPTGRDGTVLNIENYRRGIRDTLSRIAHHPSLAAIVDAAGLDTDGELEALCRNTAPRLSFITAAEYARLPVVSYPAFPQQSTVSEFAPEAANLLSESVERQTNGELVHMLTDAAGEYLYASNLEDFAYITQLLQAREAERYVHTVRCDPTRGLPAIISRLADCRPTVSDAMIDFYCRPRASIYYARRFFAPILLIPSLDGCKVSFVISNERTRPFTGMLNYRILDSENNLVYNGQDEVSVKERAVTPIAGRDLSDVVSGHEHEYYLEYCLRDGANTASRGTLLFVKPKRFAFKDPCIKAQIGGSGKTMTLTLSASAFAKDVRISFRGYDTDLRDNFIDITSQTPLKMNFTVQSGTPSAFDLEDAICIKSVYNIGNVNNSLKKSRFDTKIGDVLEKLKY